MALATVPTPELAKPDPTVTPPLGDRPCPDPRWAARRAYVLQGVQTFLGTHWVWTFNGSGVAARLSPLPPVLPAPASMGCAASRGGGGGPHYPPPPPLLPIPAGPEGAVAYNTLGEYAYRDD